jgi:hypothetical protein
MTRRGSLAYYLAAWICGSFFMSVAISIKDPSQLSAAGDTVYARFFTFYFFALILGAAPAMIVGLLLRRAMILIGRERPLLWILIGALVTTLLVIAVGSWGRSFLEALSPRRVPVGELMTFLAGGLVFVYAEGWWLAIPVGAAMAYVLYRIDRAFAPESSSPAVA